ncbi:MAG: SIMPL domain-containing protein [Chloroflexi bacterium]|nr:SIMPL domain-containing protein [Chloroflexota bacterium]
MFVKYNVRLLLFFALFLTGCAPTPQAPQVQDIQVIQAKERIVSAQGRGEVRIRPDAVRFTITVKTDGSELTTALEDNEKATQEALALLKKYEIADADIETDQPSQEEGVFEPIRYFVRQNIKVILRDLTRFETLSTEILQGGAYHISEVRFLVSDPALYKEQALNLAVSDARDKAEIMAVEIERELGEALTIRELGEALTIYQVNGYLYERGTTRYGSNLEVELPDAVYQSFNELEIQIEVVVEFQLK